MGRDEHTTGGKNSRSLPQTPKNQKIQPKKMTEEIANEFAELRQPNEAKQAKDEKKQYR
ncbi:hypothetical protein MKY41_06455 [Sporosarcina sp. FSL W7-1349]|uniref:hypothetical protein n=1 Tax=Sporosarcina sp. FSL W7-1349 TaxID=2921561 RepID=UPI0030FAC303